MCSVVQKATGRHFADDIFKLIPLMKIAIFWLWIDKGKQLPFTDGISKFMLLMNDTFRKLSRLGHSHVLCVGDFNYPKIDWDTHPSGSWNTDYPNYLLIECIHDCYWYQHVNKPTRGRGIDKPSVLDLVLSNEEGMVDSVDIEALGASDHVLINITCRSHFDEELSKLIFHYENADYNKIRELLYVVWQEVLSEPSVIDNIDEQWNIFSKRYHEAEKICVPVRRLKAGRKFCCPIG